jgi:hypothetical protein
VFLISCYDKPTIRKSNLASKLTSVYFKLLKPIQVGDKVQLYGGYEYDPIYLKNHQQALVAVLLFSSSKAKMRNQQRL